MTQQKRRIGVLGFVNATDTGVVAKEAYEDILTFFQGNGPEIKQQQNSKEQARKDPSADARPSLLSRIRVGDKVRYSAQERKIYAEDGQTGQFTSSSAYRCVFVAAQPGRAFCVPDAADADGAYVFRGRLPQQNGRVHYVFCCAAAPE